MSLILPSYQSGFAPRDYEPAYPSLWQGCVAAYAPLLGPTGLVLRDSVGGNHGSLTNMDGNDWVISDKRYALDFDGVNDEITFSNIKTLDTTTALTVSLFYRPRNTANFGGILKQWNIAQPQSGIYLFQANSDLIWQVGNVSNTRLTATSVLTASAWHSIVCTKTANLMQIFVNGILANSVAAAGSNNSNGQPFNLGNNYGGLDFVNANIDDVRVYDRLLSPNEIRLLASRRGIGYDYKTHRSYSKTQSSGLLKRLILTGQT